MRTTTRPVCSTLASSARTLQMDSRCPIPSSSGSTPRSSTRRPTYPFSSTIHGTTSVGTTYNNQIERGTYAQGYTLAPGTSTVAGATNLFAANQLGNNQIVTLGYYIQQQASWSDLLFATVALRADDNSAFGQPFQLQYYPSASVSWVIGDEPWFSKSATFSSLRLRAAYGWSGQRPQFQEAQTYLNAVPVNIRGFGEAGGLSYGNFGNPEPQAGAIQGARRRLRRRVLARQDSAPTDRLLKTTTDALISVLNPVSVGGVTTGSGAGTSTRFINIGQVDNRGIEALLTSNLIDTRNARLDFTINWSMNKNKLITLGPGQAPIPLGLVYGQWPIHPDAVAWIPAGELLPTEPDVHAPGQRDRRAQRLYGSHKLDLPWAVLPGTAAQPEPDGHLLPVLQALDAVRQPERVVHLQRDDAVPLLALQLRELSVGLPEEDLDQEPAGGGR